MTLRSMTQALALLGVFAGGVSVRAHHPVAESYDTSKVVTLQGTTASVEFATPHCYLFLDVKDSSGRVTRWVVEGDSPQQVVAAGLKKGVATQGTNVTVSAFAPKAGANLLETLAAAPQAVVDAAKNGRLVHGTELVLSDGRKVMFGASR
jgi:Family of unknown function (DUF6152)